MKIRSRGCALGCGGLLVLCVAASLYVWFVEVPRLSTAFEKTIHDGVATLVSEEVSSRFSQSELQGGADVRFSFTYLNRHMFQTGRSENAHVEIFTSSDYLGIYGVWSENASSWEIESIFIPEVTDEGRLRLTSVAEGTWILDKMDDMLGGVLEQVINDWLQVNGLILTDFKLTPNALILSVIGE